MFASLTSSFSSSFRTPPPAGCTVHCERPCLLLRCWHFFGARGSVFSSGVFRQRHIFRLDPKHDKKNFKDALLGRPFGPPSSRLGKNSDMRKNKTQRVFFFKSELSHSRFGESEGGGRCRRGELGARFCFT